MLTESRDISRVSRPAAPAAAAAKARPHTGLTRSVSPAPNRLTLSRFCRPAAPAGTENAVPEHRPEVFYLSRPDVPVTVKALRLKRRPDALPAGPPSRLDEVAQRRLGSDRASTGPTSGCDADPRPAPAAHPPPALRRSTSQPVYAPPPQPPPAAAAWAVLRGSWQGAGTRQGERGRGMGRHGKGAGAGSRVAAASSRHSRRRRPLDPCHRSTDGAPHPPPSAGRQQHKARAAGRRGSSVVADAEVLHLAVAQVAAPPPPPPPPPSVPRAERAAVPVHASARGHHASRALAACALAAQATRGGNGAQA